MGGSFELEAVQSAVRVAGVDGWLFAQFRGRDPLADRVLGLPTGVFQTRRWYYFVPADGEPRGLVHAIEPEVLSGLPGTMQSYRTWGELEGGIKGLLEGAVTVAMQYSPQNHLPVVATVDAGTVELVKAAGAEVVSSADLVQQFTAVLSDEQIDSHRFAAERIPKVVHGAFRLVRERTLDGHEITEYELQQFIIEQLRASGLEPGDPPDVAVNAHASDPHYAPSPQNSTSIREGDWLLLDVWAKQPNERAVFADITWVAQVGDDVPEERTAVFEIVRGARDAAIELVVSRYAAGEPVRGFEADRAAREVIEAAGYGEVIQHRTGHSITEDVHGSGANLDDFETHDDRQLVRRTCFSVEPGIYLEEFGVRSEINILIPPEGAPEVTGIRQEQVIALLSEKAPELLSS